MEGILSTASRKRPKKLVGGFGNYCCVPGCKSASYDKNRRLIYLYSQFLKENRGTSKKEMAQCVEACS